MAYMYTMNIKIEIGFLNSYIHVLMRMQFQDSSRKEY